jgi:uncharacterized protein (TIGR03083 family)
MTARRPALQRATAMRLAVTENARFLAQLRRLSPEDWTKPTACPDWDVRDLVGHVVGMTEMSASVLEQARQLRAARKAGGDFLDALTALQVDKHATDSSEQLVERFAVIGPRSVKGRRRTPAFVRARALPIPQTVGGRTESWTIGFLVDTVLTRDPWMHRMDIARATGRELELTPDHDGILVDDVVTEWADRHGQPCTVVLDGPAGGRWDFHGGGPTLSGDAVEFCRGLSGRGEPALATPVPF